MKKPELIKAGDRRLKLGLLSQPPLVDCRVVAEDLYQIMQETIKQRNELLKALDLLVAFCDSLKFNNYQIRKAKQVIKNVTK